ncbi:MAG: peptidoglycan D,D-transpeptidase FtsI family protein [Opitutales bacterium]
MNHSLIPVFRLVLILICVFAAFGVVGTRLYLLHVVKQPELRARIDSARLDTRTIPARRGAIRDSRGNLLAITRELYTVGVDPVAAARQPPEPARLMELARQLNVPRATVANAFETDDGRVRWRKLAGGVTPEGYDAIRALGIRGVYGNRVLTRTYPAGHKGAHLVGFVNREGTPVTGAERRFDYYLRGQDGFRVSERDGDRRELAQFRLREVAVEDGMDVVLTVDPMVQHLVEREVADVVQAFSPDAVSVIVSDPATGAVLALANYPTFDPNTFWDFPVDSHRNRALMDLFEPGSTFKIVPAAAALEEALVRPEDRFPTGYSVVEYKGRRVKLPGDHKPYGELSVRDIVIKSSNRGAAWLGMLLGKQRLHRYAEAFGFGNPTGIDLDGEQAGILAQPADWDGLTITRLPMGHAVAATPLQVHAAMGVLANGGVFVEPRVAERVHDAEGRPVLAFDPVEPRRVVSGRTALLLTEMLAEVAAPGGTAPQAALDGFRVAGKTGTTQKIINGRYSHRHHVASFSGYFPAEDPRFLITIVVDEPQGDHVGYGGLVAAPAFRSIAEGMIRYYGLEPGETGPVPTLAMEGGPYDRSR